MTRRLAFALAGLALACLTLVGCSDDATDAPASEGPEVTTPPRPVEGSLVVLAETDLAPAMTALVPAFEQANPGATVTVETLPAADVVARVEAGAGDVVALFDTTAMDGLEGGGLVAAVVLLPGPGGARAGAVVASSNPSAATRFVELASR